MTDNLEFKPLDSNVKWKDIDNFTNMYRSAKKYFDIFDASKQQCEVYYNAKIKLHGTNAGIRFTFDGPKAQGRTRSLTPDEDNFGFARWVETEVHPVWERLSGEMKTELTGFVLHGEWAGPGIQKNAGCSLIDRKSFFVFALEDTEVDAVKNKGRHYITEPDQIIEALYGEFLNDIDNFYILPWYFDQDFVIDLFKADQVNKFLDEINPIIEQIGEKDPYIQEIFDVVGEGEGLVFYDRLTASEHYMFKAKCEAHRTTKTKASAVVNAEEISENAQFAASLVTEARLSQGYDVVTENGKLELSMKEIPLFLKWVAADVQKECQAEMEANNKEWKTIAKFVNNISVKYFQARTQADAIAA